MTTQADNPSRRTLLAGIAAAPAIIALGTSPAMALPTVDRAAWDRTFARVQQARRTYEADCPAFDRAYAAMNAGKPSLDLIDWEGLRRQGLGRFDRYHTARMLDIKAAWKSYLSTHRARFGTLPPAAARTECRAALNTILEFRRLEEENEERTGYNEADERNSRLCDVTIEAEHELLATPAPDLSALLWKIEHLWGSDTDDPLRSASDSYDMNHIRPVIADARRLLSGEA